jgi:hypothetical protein
MLGFGVIPALIIIILRRSTPESPRWLAQNGHEAEAEKIGEQRCGVRVQVTDKDRERETEPAEGIKALWQPQLFRKDMVRRTFFTSVPWFLMDIATYGVGIFTPTLLAALALAGPNATLIADDIASTEGTAFLDIFLVLGFMGAIFLVEKLGRVRPQLIGFTMMAIGLVLLGYTSGLPGGGDQHLVLVFIGFATFNFFMNMGPNATTYALPAEVFPSDIRAAGHGFAAGTAKLGAAIGVFFPILLEEVGAEALLYGLAVISVIALAVTWFLRIEPAGKGLDEISGRKASALHARPSPP